MFQVPKEEIANRLVAFQAALVQHRIDAAVIRQNTDLYYLTGTVQDAHLIVPASGSPCFLVRRDVRRAEEQSPIRPVVPLTSIKELPDHLDRVCGSRPPRTLGMELDVLPASTFFFYDEKVFPKDRIVDVGTLLRQVRMIKSDWEIEMMRRAAVISDAVARAVPEFLREGVSELELCIELEAVARKAGHLGFSRVRTFNLEIYFGHILSGPEAATSSYADSPTGGPGVSPALGQGSGTRVIGRGDLVSVDTMVNHHGYLNDQTRNFALEAPPAELADAHRLSLELHAWLREAARPGAVTGELYREALEWAASRPLSQYFMGSEDASRVSFLAHGLGLEVDEFPFIARGQKTMLREGMTFAFEPKYIIPGIGIAGIENTYRVTARGLESLNLSGEQLVVVQTGPASGRSGATGGQRSAARPPGE